MMDKIMLTCREMSWLSSKELDTRLPLLTKIQMKMHVTMCKTCYRYRKQLNRIHSIIQKIAPDYNTIAIQEESETLSDSSKERIKEFLNSKRA